MIYAFILLFAGGMILGGSWSFYRSRKPWWGTAGLALLGIALVGAAIWRIQTG